VKEVGMTSEQPGMQQAAGDQFTLGESSREVHPLSNRKQQGDDIHTLKKKAMNKASKILELEGERGRLMAENIQHPNSYPKDFDVADHLKGKNYGLNTPSTSKKWHEEKNEKFLERETAQMKGALEAEYTDKHSEAQHEADMQSNMAKMHNQYSKKHSDDTVARHLRIQRLTKIAESEKELVHRFIHLKKYRAKAGLTTAGSASEGTPVQKASAAAKETGGEVKNVKAKPSTKAETEAETVATADKKAKDVLNSPELADKKSDAEKWEANGKAPDAQKSITPEGVSAMGPTHRRRNPGAAAKPVLSFSA